MTDQHRNQEIAKIKIGQKELGLDDATYRAMLEARTGKSSARDLTGVQRRQLLDHMKSLGAFKDQPRPARKPTARLIHALWKELGTVKAVNNPTKEALRAFCGRMIHPGQENAVVDPDFLDIDQASIVIEALKGWLKRVPQ